MPKGARVLPDINCYRLKTGAKGFIKPGEMGKYAGLSYDNGRRLYEEMEVHLRKKGKIPLSYGISVKTVNEYLGLDQEEIERLAEKGL